MCVLYLCTKNLLFLIFLIHFFSKTTNVTNLKRDLKPQTSPSKPFYLAPKNRILCKSMTLLHFIFYNLEVLTNAFCSSLIGQLYKIDLLGRVGTGTYLSKNVYSISSKFLFGFGK